MARKARKTTSLAKSRPPIFSPQPPPSMSRRAGRNLINTHHKLEKKRKQAIARGDTSEEQNVAAQIAALGGLERYQQASLQGQRHDRGGDTSKVLLDWLASAPGPKKARGGAEETKAVDSKTCARLRGWSGRGRKPRMLEVGALSMHNACAASGLFDMELIDLNSREPGIVQQDFMQRPLPPSPHVGNTASRRLDDEEQQDRPDDERFDVISLSLVLNFVPDAIGRGEMLRRTLEFLRPAPRLVPGAKDRDADDDNTRETLYPSLFVVLPRPCISNSRYFTHEAFGKLMALLGYEQVRAKLTEKLAYYLWCRRVSAPTTVTPATIRPTSTTPTTAHIWAQGARHRGSEREPLFVKKVINPGRTRNNFAIVLK